MTVRYELNVTTQMRAVDYDDRLRVSRELSATIAKHKRTHTTARHAEAAAKEISKSPLVVHVTVRRVEETVVGVYRNGVKGKD